MLTNMWMLCCVLPSHVWQFALKQISRDAKVAVCITTRELRIFREMCWLRFQTHVNSAHGCRALIYTHSTRGVCWLLSRSNRHSFRLWMLCVMGMWIYLYMLCEEHTSELSIEHQLDAGELIWNCQMVCVIRKLAAWKESVLRLCANTSLSSDVNWKLLFPLLTSLVSLHIYSIHMHYFHFGANARTWCTNRRPAMWRVKRHTLSPRRATVLLGREPIRYIAWGIIACSVVRLWLPTKMTSINKITWILECGVRTQRHHNTWETRVAAATSESCTKKKQKCNAQNYEYGE